MSNTTTPSSPRYSNLNLTGLTGLIFIIGILTGFAVPRFINVYNKSKGTSAPRVIAVYKSENLSKIDSCVNYISPVVTGIDSRR